MAERFTRGWVNAPEKAKIKLLTVSIRLTFTIGGISSALCRAAADLNRERPDIFVEPIWTDETTLPGLNHLTKEWRDVDRSHLNVSFGDDVRRSSNSVIDLYQDRWVFACRLPIHTRKQPTATDLLAGRLVVPSLAAPLIAQADRYLSETKAKGVRFLMDHPGDLARLIDTYPDAALFVPESLLSAQLGLHNVSIVAPLKPLFSSIVAQIPERNAVTSIFLRYLKNALAEPKRKVLRGRPTITLRQIRYFRIVYRLRRVSAAAHAVNISQPSLSEQLRKLETSLNGPLFERHGDGVTPTVRGDRFTRFAELIDGGFRHLSGKAPQLAQPAKRHITLGVLPSVNQYGFLVNRITEALLEIQTRHPTVRLIVQEAPNGILQDWIMRGLVGIAVVETGLPHMPRLPLGSFENLAAIVHASHELLPPGPVALADLLRLQLILPTNRFGLRQLLDTAATERGLSVQPHMEIDALTMAVSMLERLPVATVLPTSAVQREVASGNLVVHPIVDPVIYRRLYMIYSAERTLSRPERELINMLRKRLASSTN